MSQEAYPAKKLDLFSDETVDTSILGREWVDFRPVTQLTKGSPIIFNVPGTSNDYVDLKQTRLYMKCRILKPDGQPVENTDKTAFVNIPHSSVFRQANLFLQQKEIDPGVGINYAYKAYIDALLNHSDGKMTEMTSQLFYQDVGELDSTDPIEGMNPGLGQRYVYTRDGQHVELEGPLAVDFMKQERYIPNGVEMNLRLTPNSDAFALMSDDNTAYRFDITECVLKVCKLKMNPGLLAVHAEQFKLSPALFPFTRSEIKAFNVSNGAYTFSTDNLFEGLVPDKLTVGLVAAAALNGSYQRNPFNFNNYNCNYVDFSVDNRSLPHAPFTMNYDAGHFVTAYRSLFDEKEEKGNYISRRDYADGNALYVFKIDKKTMEHTHRKRGHTRLMLRFDTALPEPVTVVTYATFPSLVQIEESRTVNVV